MRIQKDNIVVRSATIDDAIQLNKWWNDGKVMEHAAYPGWKICDFSYQNQGYGPKIIMMLFEFLFTDETINSKFPIEKIVWDTMLENKRAQYVYENKIGARKVGIRKGYWKDQNGQLRTAVDYELSKEDFFNAR